MDTPTYKLEGVIKSRTETPDDFVGPLDVILQLLSKNKIEIADLQISLILEQYLEYLEEMKKLDLNIASEFVAMAAHLLYIKTKMLLTPEPEPLSELELLIKSLEQRKLQEEYGRIKAVAEVLSPRAATGSGMFSHSPEPIAPDKEYKYIHVKTDLSEALAGLIKRHALKEIPPVSIFNAVLRYEPYPLAIKTAHLLKKLVSSGLARFTSLFQDNSSRSEMVATFLAVLELCKLRQIYLAGTEDNCTITYVDDKRPQ